LLVFVALFRYPVGSELPKFSGGRRDFDVRKKRFRAFGMMQKWAPALSSDGAASSKQQAGM
jgi:hypothetical protein